MPSFSAVLLAGGQSTRMGRDKAMLPMPGSNTLIWQHQLRTLEELRPEEIFWSGPGRPGLPGHVRIVSDRVINAGPLAGIGACLDLLQGDLLLALAVDLPRMTTAYLESLLARCSPLQGAVAQHGDFFEPLAAIYPKKLHALAAKHLGQGRYALQDFIREAAQLDALQVFSLDESDLPLFKNLNSPADLQDLCPHEESAGINDAPI
jgi:molybdopterin-guanine dinucleotide biosynthesis protein A